MNSFSLVIILDGNSEIGAHLWSTLGYFICLRHLYGSRAVLNLIFQILLHTCAPCSDRIILYIFSESIPTPFYYSINHNGIAKIKRKSIYTFFSLSFLNHLSFSCYSRYRFSLFPFAHHVETRSN